MAHAWTWCAAAACKYLDGVDRMVAPQAVQRELKSERHQRERAASVTKVLESEKASLQAQQAALQAHKASLQASGRMQGVHDTHLLLLRSEECKPEKWTAPATAQAEKAALEDQSKLLLRRFSDLEAAAADLQSTNDGLLQQVSMDFWYFKTSQRSMHRVCIVQNTRILPTRILLCHGRWKRSSQPATPRQHERWQNLTSCELR